YLCDHGNDPCDHKMTKTLLLALTYCGQSVTARDLAAKPVMERARKLEARPGPVSCSGTCQRRRDMTMPAPKRVERPLSPFMIGPYYRPQMTSMSSIFIRITGLGLIVAFAMTVVWLLAAATSKEAFDCVNWLVGSWFGKLVYTLS